MPKNTKAPGTVSIMGMSGLNVAASFGTQTDEPAQREVTYNQITDECLASRRGFLHDVRTHAEVAAATSGDLPLGVGLSLRAPMAGRVSAPRDAAPPRSARVTGLLSVSAPALAQTPNNECH